MYCTEVLSPEGGCQQCQMCFPDETDTSPCVHVLRVRSCVTIRMNTRSRKSSICTHDVRPTITQLLPKLYFTVISFQWVNIQSNVPAGFHAKGSSTPRDSGLLYSFCSLLYTRTHQATVCSFHFPCHIPRRRCKMMDRWLVLKVATFPVPQYSLLAKVGSCNN